MQQRMKEQRNEYLQYVSLQPCRKVSIVVRVKAIDDDNEKCCIFPHYKDNNDEIASHAAEGYATPTGKETRQESASSPNAASSDVVHARDVVVVNPTAFGRYIPSQVTMETAKLVAQVANISSEDWARLYEFHHVMWPPPRAAKSLTSTNSQSQDAYNTLDSLSRAVVQDLLVEHRSSLLISLGQEGSCIGTNDMSIGLWPKIMNQCSVMLETKGIVRLTMVEILEPASPQRSTGNSNSSNSGTATSAGDSFRDLLAPSNQKPNKISLRHVDMKGAIIEGLTEVSIDSMPALLEALSRSRHRRAQRRRARGSSSSSSPATASIAVIGTLH